MPFIALAVLAIPMVLFLVSPVLQGEYVGALLLLVLILELGYYGIKALKNLNAIMAVTAFGFLLCYVLPFGQIVGSKGYISRYLDKDLEYINYAALYLVIYIGVVFFVEERTTRGGKILLFPLGENDNSSYRHYLMTALAMLLISLAGTIWFRESFAFVDFTNRLIEGAGTGHLQIFGYCGYLAAGAICWMRIRGMIGFGLGLTICLVSGLFFLGLGYRGGFLYPIVIYALVSSVIRFGAVQTCLAGVIFAPLLFEIDALSSAVRVVYTDRGDFDVGEIVGMYISARSTADIPMAFSHIDLLSSLIEAPALSGLRIGSADTLLPSLLNWLPRALFPDKGLTTGPTLAIAFFPDVLNQSVGHNSSLTTGPVVEGYYAFGLFGIFAFAYIHGSIVSMLRRWFEPRSGSFEWGTIWIIVIWLFGFSVFVDDLGGLVNKAVLIAGASGLLVLARRGTFAFQS